MMGTVFTSGHLLLAGLAVPGMLALAAATDRHAEHLLGRFYSTRSRLLARAVGWLLLCIALAASVAVQGMGIGITWWLTWLGAAALAWVFTFAHWARQPPARDRPARAAPRGSVDVASSGMVGQRAVAAGLLVATVLVFGIGLVRVQTPPLERNDALRGTVGPWSFIFAEADRQPPERVAMDIPMKEFRLRFCDDCDPQIRQATLKVNRPRNVRATGMGFMGQRWERRTEISLPNTLNAQSELWLTVTGKDGSVYQTFWRMDQVSPATVAWFEQQRRQYGSVQ